MRSKGPFQALTLAGGLPAAGAMAPAHAQDTVKVGVLADWTFPWVCGNCTEPKFKNLAN